jgi:predicted dehydrogenase
MPRPLRLLVVGCGGIAHAYLDALQRTDAFAVVACADPDPARAQAAASRMGAEPADCAVAWRKNGGEADAALVLTPPDTHADLSVELLSLSLHVLCEKPLARSLPEAERMLHAARAHGRILTMGSKFRYTKDVARCKELLAAGLIGRVALFENVFCSRVDMTRRWNSDPKIAGGGVLIDNGCHSVDIARHLLGPIARVQAMFGRPLQPLAVEDTARLLFESASGAMGSIDLSWSLHKEAAAYVRLYGEGGAIEVGWRESRYKRSGDSDWVRFGDGYDKVAAFLRQIENFAAAARGEEALLVTDEDALASVRVLDAAYRSAREQKWHEVPATPVPD